MSEVCDIASTEVGPNVMVFVTLFWIPPLSLYRGDLGLMYGAGVFLLPPELPKQLGNALFKIERTAGRQQHMMLTKSSRTLQYAVGTLSSGIRGQIVSCDVRAAGLMCLDLQVALVVVAKLTRADSRTMLTTVMLRVQDSQNHISMEFDPQTEGQECLQKPDAEHQHQLYPFLPPHVELPQLWYREQDDDEIEHDVDAGLRPCKSVEAEAVAFRFARPTRPVVADRSAVEEGGQGRCRYVGQTYAHHDKTNPSESLAREHFEVQQEHGDLGQALCYHVQDL